MYHGANFSFPFTVELSKRCCFLIMTSICLVAGFSFEGRREPGMVWNASTGMYVPEKENSATRQKGTSFLLKFSSTNYVTCTGMTKRALRLGIILY
jgi:hypothetical protein